MTDRRQLILASVDDLTITLTYDDRREDEDLPRGAIEEAVKAGEITVDEMVDQFRRGLARRLYNASDPVSPELHAEFRRLSGD
jgi:hypothetical protein